MRIDLHCHTKQVKSGDGLGRNVTVELFREKVIDADVKIIAITNHNAFDLAQFITFKDAVGKNCLLWPGVEIDIKQPGGKKWHLIVVANPDNVNIFANQVNELFKGKSLENDTCTIQEVYDALNGCDTIYIAHFHKTPAISDEDHEELLRVVGDDSRVFDETANTRSLGVFANFGYNVLIGSDVKDWNEYEKSNFADLRLPVDSFQHFCLLAKRDPVIINTLLSNKRSNTYIASPHKSVKIPLTIYEDVNIIFGQKGTGKSEILQSLFDKFVSQGISCRKYTGADKDEDFNALLKTDDMETDLTKVNANSCEENFNVIFNWVDVNPTLFNNYKNWYLTKDNNANKRRMKITDASALVEHQPEYYHKYSNDYTELNLIENKLSDIDYSLYLNEEEVKTFRELFQKMRNINQKLLIKDIIQMEAVKLVNYSLNRIKSIADQNSNTVSKPSTTGFIEFAMNRIELLNNAKKILKNIGVYEFNELTLIGMLEGKGSIYINRKYRMLCEESKTAEFLLGIKKLREIKRKLEKIVEKITSADVSTYVTEFTEACRESSVSSTKCFLGLSKQVVSEDGELYQPSNGERGILLLQQILADGVDAYFLDEPELGMGNSYIDTNIRPIIAGLAKQHKTVVVATHNANIAVRTLPYMSIFRTHQNGEYKTYVGNPFDDCLVNIDDDTDVKSWTMESLHTLEGGRQAFYERKNIYETSGEECN